MINFPRRIIIGLAIWSGLTFEASAQSDNYWSWSSNTDATLVGGAVVGKGAGPSAIFYNPALINHNNEPSLALSANLVSLQSYRVQNIAGDELDADMLTLKVQPRFISLVLPSKSKRLGIQLAVFSPTSESLEYTKQYQSSVNIIQRTAGKEQYDGYLRYQRDYNDTWGGAGFSYKLADRLYVGGSLFISYKSLNLLSFQSGEAYQNSDSVLVNGDMEPRYIASSGSEEEFSYWYWSAILKLGTQYTTKNKRFNIGINLTLPSIPIYGEAYVRKLYYRSNIYDNNAGEFVGNENTLGVIENGKVRVKTPFSLALGAAYNSKEKARVLLFTVEYFSQIDPYHMVTSDLTANWLPGYVSQNLNENTFMSYSYQASSVTNLALGYKSVISEKLSYLAGFRTDFTVGNNGASRYVNGDFGVTQINMNRWHFSSGLLLEILRFKVIAGLQYSFGRVENVTQAANYSSPVEYNPISDQSLNGVRRQDAIATLNELTLFFAVSIGAK